MNGQWIAAEYPSRRKRPWGSRSRHVATVAQEELRSWKTSTTNLLTHSLGWVEFGSFCNNLFGCP